MSRASYPEKQLTKIREEAQLNEELNSTPLVEIREQTEPPMESSKYKKVIQIEEDFGLDFEDVFIFQSSYLDNDNTGKSVADDIRGSET